MTLAPSSFLQLPVELRLQIYEYVVDWPWLWPLFEEFHSEPQGWHVEFGEFPQHPFQMSTPNIFLVNHQITAEAPTVLWKKAFTLISPVPYSLDKERPMRITEFVCKHALQKMEHVILDMNMRHDKCWYDTIRTLFHIWRQGHSLRLLEVYVEDFEHGWYSSSIDKEVNILWEVSSRIGRAERRTS